MAARSLIVLFFQIVFCNSFINIHVPIAAFDICILSLHPLSDFISISFDTGVPSAIFSKSIYFFIQPRHSDRHSNGKEDGYNKPFR